MKKILIIEDEPDVAETMKMLVERDNNLCLKCHAQVQGAGVAAGQVVIGTVNHSARGFLNRGTCWSAGCHSAVHGSNVSPNLYY